MRCSVSVFRSASKSRRSSLVRRAQAAIGSSKRSQFGSGSTDQLRGRVGGNYGIIFSISTGLWLVHCSQVQVSFFEGGRIDRCTTEIIYGSSSMAGEPAECLSRSSAPQSSRALVAKVLHRAHAQLATRARRFFCRGNYQILPKPDAILCLSVPFEHVFGRREVFSTNPDLALYSPCLLGYTRRRRRGRVVEGAPLLRE